MTERERERESEVHFLRKESSICSIPMKDFITFFSQIDQSECNFYFEINTKRREVHEEKGRDAD